MEVKRYHYFCTHVQCVCLQQSVGVSVGEYPYVRVQRRKQGCSDQYGDQRNINTVHECVSIHLHIHQFIVLHFVTQHSHVPLNK